MHRIMLSSKVHGITVTNKDINYEGSLQIDSDLLKKARIYEGELVQVVNLNTGDRFETYIISGEAGSGLCSLNGGAARRGEVGDKLLLMSYCVIDSDNLKTHKPVILVIGEGNKVISRK